MFESVGNPADRTTDDSFNTQYAKYCTMMQDLGECKSFALLFLLLDCDVADFSLLS
jgi:hypothetical protein